jgi:hypothetical protein
MSPAAHQIGQPTFEQPSQLDSRNEEEVIELQFRPD